VAENKVITCTVYEEKRNIVTGLVHMQHAADMLSQHDLSSISHALHGVGMQLADAAAAINTDGVVDISKMTSSVAGTGMTKPGSFEGFVRFPLQSFALVCVLTWSSCDALTQDHNSSDCLFVTPLQRAPYIHVTHTHTHTHTHTYVYTYIHVYIHTHTHTHTHTRRSHI
jgi:hypothetical protein